MASVLLTNSKLVLNEPLKMLNCNPFKIVLSMNPPPPEPMSFPQGAFPSLGGGGYSGVERIGITVGNPRKLP